MGIPLAVQWLGLGAFTAGAQVQSLVREPRSCMLHRTVKKKKKEEKEKKRNIITQTTK